jgi:hypothetical protein
LLGMEMHADMSTAHALDDFSIAGTLGQVLYTNLLGSQDEVAGGNFALPYIPCMKAANGEIVDERSVR